MVVAREVDISRAHHAQERPPNLPGVGDRDPAEPLFRLDRADVTHCRVGAHRARRSDEAVLETFHCSHHGRLLLDRVVVVDDADAPHQSHRDRHRRFRHRVHRGRDERTPQTDVSGDASVRVYVLGREVDVPWEHEEVVVRQPRLLRHQLLQREPIRFVLVEDLLNLRGELGLVVDVANLSARRQEGGRERVILGEIGGEREATRFGEQRSLVWRQVAVD
mmetsp:Transcript_6312/g.12200  ORF Transcript_6312/g.12200 Transcript_6312/m.12200 type:complete len:220 (-) Transcript_6312:144-803(-)